MPVELEADFFGRKILSPYLLSASPLTDGFEQMNKAYEYGWAGGIMKTAFDNVPIHIPVGYMFTFNSPDLWERGQCLGASTGSRLP